MSAENASQTAPKPDSMVFFDNYETALAAGTYRFVLQQTVTLDGGETHHYYRDQQFEVIGPRYVIEESEIQAHFPPPGGVGDYQNVLPHLVLRTRNLPWERKLWPGPEREPWLALLLLTESELLNGRAEVKTGTVADLKPDRPDICSRTENGASILLPKFIRTEEEQTPLRLLDLDLDVFLKICPSRADLPCLAHIRQVDTENKVLLEMPADGEFSVLVANRFPSQGANTVHLISLEGWETLLAASSSASQQSARLRLITLGSWTFVNDPAGHDTFGGLMQELRGNALPFGVKLDSPSANAYVQQALARGYVPLDYLPLNSSPAFAWYRGPLSAIRRPSLNRPAFHRADAALIFDEQTSLMDVSYASAWQLGRLLALSAPAFSKGVRLFVERCHNAAEFARQIQGFLELHRNAFPEVTGNMQQPGGEQVAIADELVQWIARLVLLYPVPFHYLFPHAALLPRESLRFFHLDDNWVDALVDGALSIAVRNAADRGVASRADLQSALSKIVYQYRLRLQGKRPEWDPKERYMDIPKSGFLLRSRIVSDWPGIEVTALASGATDENIPKILRMDQVADGVLFCLVRGAIEKLIFREPREGLTFGVTSEGIFRGRRSNNVIRVRPDLMRAGAGDGVVDVAALRQKVEQQENVRVGAAEFAVQMIRMPEEQTIEWS